MTNGKRITDVAAPLPHTVVPVPQFTSLRVDRFPATAVHQAASQAVFYRSELLFLSLFDGLRLVALAFRFLFCLFGSFFLDPCFLPLCLLSGFLCFAPGLRSSCRRRFAAWPRASISACIFINSSSSAISRLRAAAASAAFSSAASRLMASKVCHPASSSALIASMVSLAAAVMNSPMSQGQHPLPSSARRPKKNHRRHRSRRRRGSPDASRPSANPAPILPTL